jgi:dephospho-CoA kinase
MKKIGITGSIGSGKSTVTKLFATLGIPVYDADSRAKTLMVSSPTLISNIQHLFGAEAYLSDGSLNRTFIAQEAFHNKQLLTQLNALVHPAVFDDFDQWCAQQSPATYVIKEAALMFESDSYKQLDEVIVVTAPETLRIQRTIARDGLTAEAVIARMKNQLSEDEKRKRAQYEIINDERHLLIPQVLKLNELFRL